MKILSCENIVKKSRGFVVIFKRFIVKSLLGLYKGNLSILLFYTIYFIE